MSAGKISSLALNWEKSASVKLSRLLALQILIIFIDIILGLIALMIQGALSSFLKRFLEGGKYYIRTSV